jgi:hypothetical protein
LDSSNLLDVNKENLSRKLYNGKWHMITIVYDDYFGDKNRPHLRTGSNILFYFDGKIYK